MMLETTSRMPGHLPWLGQHRVEPRWGLLELLLSVFGHVGGPEWLSEGHAGHDDVPHLLAGLLWATILPTLARLRCKVCPIAVGRAVCTAVVQAFQDDGLDLFPGRAVEQKTLLRLARYRPQSQCGLKLFQFRNDLHGLQTGPIARALGCYFPGCRNVLLQKHWIFDMPDLRHLGCCFEVVARSWTIVPLVVMVDRGRQELGKESNPMAVGPIMSYVLPALSRECFASAVHVVQHMLCFQRPVLWQRW
mmetsp:Transcript_49146/g.104603  ORF Transcript_49146/g.104603 Transcript_49146/m.104603 type:complete len:248 (-) Transcript_49146:933-1676(-)